ncbi:MAG: hypothetical protein JRH11_05830 [Deltaproteobacteria bacterium]|nr:hypothetical protein [Deltaproteobacteria bacterium]
MPTGLYIAHATLAEHHDTWFYAHENIATAPVVTGVPGISNTLWNSTYSSASLTEDTSAGWIVARGIEARGAAAVDMTASSDKTGTVGYLSGGVLTPGTSSPDGEALVLNAEAATTVITVTVGTRNAMATVLGRAGATIAMNLFLPAP